MKTLRVFVIVLALLVIILIALPLMIDANQFRPKLQSELTNALGRPVSIGNLSLRIFSGAVSAQDLSIADDPSFSRSPFVQAKSLNVGVEMMPLIFSRKVNVTTVNIDQPQIALLQNSSGSWNYATLGSKSTPPPATAGSSSQSGIDLSVKSIHIRDGRLTIAKTSGGAKPMVLDNVNIEVRDFSPASSMPFSLTAKLAGGGDLKLDGKAGPLAPSDLDQTPASLALHASHVDPVAAGIVAANTGIGGLVATDSTANSDGKQAQLKGTVKADQLKLVKGGSPATRQVELAFTIDHVLATRSGSLVQGDVHIGKAEAKLTGTYSPSGDSMAIKANVSGPSMPVEELEGMLPALNVVLPAGSSLQGGTAFLKADARGTLENLSAAGSVGLNNTKLAGYDFGKNQSAIGSLAGIQSSSGTDIQTLSTDFKQDQHGTSLQNIKLIVSNIGEMTGAGTVSPDHTLDFKMQVAPKQGVVPASFGGKIPAAIPFMIHGTASAPKIEPDVKGMATSEINSLKGNATKSATGILDGFLGKKKNQ